MSETRLIRILIADDFKILREVIRLHVERAGDMDVIEEATQLDDALERTRELEPDVILMNDYLPPVDSAHAAGLFRNAGINIPIVVISMQAEADIIQRSFQHGVNGFLQKDEIDKVLIEAIRSVERGERYLSPKSQMVYGSTQE